MAEEITLEKCLGQLHGAFVWRKFGFETVVDDTNDIAVLVPLLNHRDVLPSEKRPRRVVYIDQIQVSLIS